ncbi:hypothetical protein N7455_000865 [Penicillium solitum]|uniref:uncharacterized protein n=1 Tax=Penicillium solitum TaxID=60172 RepID=UPI0017A2D533|nr:hypothetical protein HAV15_007434 [Penicillium sp. str. \
MTEPVIGMGAPHDHDYHAVEQWIAANCNQATDLPATGAFELPVIEPALNLDSNFGLWYSQVVQVLKWHNLYRLVDPDQKRPFRDHPNSALWLQLTKQVRAWLGRCIDPDLEQELVVEDNKVEYADEFMRVLKDHMKSSRRGAIKRACFDIWDARLEDLPTIREFVSVLKQRLHSAIDLEANILPYHVLIVILRQLETVPTLDAFAMSEIRKLEARANPVADTTMADFYDACTAILNYVEEKELDPEVATPSVATPSAHSKAVDFLRK